MDKVEDEEVDFLQYWRKLDARNDVFKMKAGIAGDVNVLKMHFLMQIHGLYKRDVVTGLLNTDSLHKDIREVDINVYNKAVNVKIWISGKFIMHVASRAEK